MVWSSSSIYSLPLLLATKAPFCYLPKGWGVRYMTQDEPISTSFHMSQLWVRQNPKWSLGPKRSQSRALLKAIRKLDFLSARLEWKRMMELKLPQPSCEHELREESTQKNTEEAGVKNHSPVNPRQRGFLKVPSNHLSTGYP